MLRLLSRVGRSGRDEGYVPIEEILRSAQAFGFQPAQLDYAVQRMLGGSLADPYPRQSPAREGPSEPVTHLRLTTIGAYAVDRLVPTFSYLDAMIVDTPIVLMPYREQIGDVRTIGERLARTELFVNYLDEAWSLLEGSEFPFLWPGVSAQVKEQLNQIRARVEPGRLPFPDRT